MARLLIVTNIFPPLIGGPATFADRLAHVLAARGHRVTVVCSSATPTDASDRERPFRVVRVSTANRYAYEVQVRAVLVRELLAHRRILVAGLESYVADAVRLAPRRYILRVPGDTVWESARNYGVTSLGFDEFQAAAAAPPLVQGIAAQRRRSLALADLVVTPSHYLDAVVARWPGVPARRRVIHNGVALDDYPARAPAARGDAALRVLFVGRLTNWKGCETLLLAGQGLASASFTIVGDGPELPLLQGLAAQLGAAAPHAAPFAFLGRQPEDAVRRHMLAHDVLVLPSNYEGLSHTLLEACAAGLVPIASDIGGNREVIQDGVNGLLVGYGDVAGLRHALESLVADDALRLELAVAARARAADFPFSRTVDGYAALLEEAGP